MLWNKIVINSITIWRIRFSIILWENTSKQRLAPKTPWRCTQKRTHVRFVGGTRRRPFCAPISYVRTSLFQSLARRYFSFSWFHCSEFLQCQSTTNRNKITYFQTNNQRRCLLYIYYLQNRKTNYIPIINSLNMKLFKRFRSYEKLIFIRANTYISG